MVYYSVGISHGYRAEYKLDRNRAKDALEELVYSARRRHRDQSIPVYLTVGGSRNDSTGIAEALKANMLHTSIELLPGTQGVQASGVQFCGGHPSTADEIGGHFAPLFWSPAMFALAGRM
ncbi:hypothetical protein V5799_011199 [Amblyomma americanum]|uniref:Uncharacterized protein n=1 Tax=Amblyomma americanum TaxID=6943 RepID=A0AAQ4EI20_AMBAM